MRTQSATDSTIRSSRRLPEEVEDDLLGQVERLMLRLGRGNRVDRAGTMVQEHLGTGGKRLRARLALRACHAGPVPLSDSIAWAAAVELLHNATLVHDDIQDGDRTRRGKPTLWARHGVSQAINAGDLMLMLPFLALGEMQRNPAQLSVELARAAAEVARGQAEELSLLDVERLDRASYEEVATAKTGALLALPVLGAAILAGYPNSIVRELGCEFAQIGLLFQLQDDVLDLFGDKGRDQRGGDIYEGKVSALVVAHVAAAPETQDELLSILRTPRAQKSEAHVARARALFAASGALPRVLERIVELEQRVLASPVLSERPALLEVARTLVDQALLPISHELAGLPGGKTWRSVPSS